MCQLTMNFKKYPHFRAERNEDKTKLYHTQNFNVILGNKDASDLEAYINSAKSVRTHTHKTISVIILQRSVNSLLNIKNRRSDNSR
jgi:hypothetical protein